MFKKNAIKKTAVQIAKNIPVKYCETCKKRSSRCSCMARKALSLFALVCLSVWLMSCKAPSKTPIKDKHEVTMFTIEFTYDGNNVEGVMSGNFPKYIARDVLEMQKKLQAKYDLIKMENQIFEMGQASK
jgi:hypothetical protein